MKKISNHLGEIIIAVACVALLISSITVFSAPISSFYNSIVEKETAVGNEVLSGIEDVDISNIGIGGGSGIQIYDYENDTGMELLARVDSTSGATVSHTARSTTGFIKIKSGRTVKIHVFPTESGTMMTNLVETHVYDAEKNYIGKADDKASVVAPDGGGYIRVMLSSTTKDNFFYLGVFYDEVGNTPVYASVSSQWKGLKITGYGDSLTASKSTSFVSWLGTVSGKMSMTQYNRGIGGTAVGTTATTAWVSDGSAEALATYGEYAIYGEYIDRPSGSNTQPTHTIAIDSDMMSDERVGTIPTDSDVVVVFAGANGMTKDNYETMINKIQSRCPNAVILCCGLPWQYDSTRTNVIDHATDNVAIQEVAEAKGCYYVDLNAKLGITTDNFDNYHVDFIHFNKAGYDKIADIIINTLKNISPN